MNIHKMRFSLTLAGVFVGLLLLLPGDAHAAGYLDPGSGSTIAQGVIAVLAGISRFFRKIKSFFVKSQD
ncbi:MAG: hypothetical protein IJD04_05140 [Desulfovibrionaceae bacterium]|nr:hypothetical protein [Desulfovibrionaceae bacterium]